MKSATLIIEVRDAFVRNASGIAPNASGIKCHAPVKRFGADTPRRHAARSGSDALSETGCMHEARVDESHGRHPGRALEILLENYRSFLRFLERRVGSREAAEDILQDAFTRNLAKVEDVSEEAIIPWFYRTLRNAAIDHHRRRVTAEKAFEAFAKEIETAENPPEDLHGEICACVRRLASTLKPEYAEILEAVDVNGTPVKAFATEKGVSPSNAGVRLFRAREALRRRVIESCGTCAEHGCFNCSCRARPNP